MKNGNCGYFCGVCDHGVMALERHCATEEHRRNLKKASGKFVGLEPRMTMPKEVMLAKKHN